MRVGSVGRAAEAAQRQRGDVGQFGSRVGSARAGEAAQQRCWMRRRQLGGGRQRGGRAASAVAAERWQRWQHGVGSGTVAEAERRQPIHHYHCAANFAINCSRTTWRRSSVPLWTEGRWRIAEGIVIFECFLSVFIVLCFGWLLFELLSMGGRPKAMVYFYFFYFHNLNSCPRRWNGVPPCGVSPTRLRPNISPTTYADYLLIVGYPY
jgi:hypothetical protein